MNQNNKQVEIGPTLPDEDKKKLITLLDMAIRACKGEPKPGWHDALLSFVAKLEFKAFRTLTPGVLDKVYDIAYRGYRQFPDIGETRTEEYITMPALRAVLDGIKYEIKR